VIYFDSEQYVAEKEAIEELSGKLGSQDQEDKLMRSVLENDTDMIDKGKLISDGINQGLQSFTPDLLYQQLVKNYTLANKILGPSLIKLATGYDPEYIKKNIIIPEFRKELKFKLERNLETLKEEGLLDSEFMITDSGYLLSSLVMYFEELDKLRPQGIHGTREHRKISHYGSKENVRAYKKGDRYKDLAIKHSTKLAIRRGHTKLHAADLRVFERESKGQNYIVYGIDSSGSMKGNKIAACKRAGIALCYKALQEKDKVGLIVFGSDIKHAIEPTTDFGLLLRHIAAIRASKQTDFVATIRKAIELFPSDNVTKHLILITDAMPNIGTNPEQTTIETVAQAKNRGITISVVGINLDEAGRKLAEKIVEVGAGRLYAISNTENVDSIVLEDYYSL